MIGKILQGKYIVVNILSDYFEHVGIMLLDHFDHIKYENTVFALGVCNFVKASEIKNYFNKKVIVYQLEQLMGNCGNQESVYQVIENIKSADEIWDYDSLNADYLNYFSIKVNKILPLLYSPTLDNIISDTNPYIDVLFYGWINNRRYKIIEKLQATLLNKVNLVWVYGDSNIEKYIRNSKVILNIHAYEPWNRQEQVRMFYPLINGKTNISEISQINYMYDEIIEESLDNLSDKIIEVCTTDIWKNFGISAKDTFKERTKNYLLNNI
jgi:hypothetical protein